MAAQTSPTMVSPIDKVRYDQWVLNYHQTSEVKGPSTKKSLGSYGLLWVTSRLAVCDLWLAVAALQLADEELMASRCTKSLNCSFLENVAV